MSRYRAILASVLALAGVAVILVLPACRRGEQAPTTRPRPVTPYPGYFQSQVGDDVYLFATLAEKTAFHTQSAVAIPFMLFVSRAGKRVYISSLDPALVPRIQVAYEQARGVELAALDPVAPETRPATTPAADAADNGGAQEAGRRGD